MNKIHRIVWSAVRGAFVVTHELASSHGKPASTRRSSVAADVLDAVSPASAFWLKTLAIAVCCAVLPAPAFAAPPVNTLPTNGQIVGGAAAGNIAISGNAMTVTQNQQRMIGNWESFSIGSAASVHFAQPAGGVALNRVTGAAPSEIFGRLSATGSAFLINPNGVLFGRGAQVDVGALVATTMRQSDTDFMAGRNIFTGGNGSVINQGNLTARQGGYIALLAPEVRNEGIISASLGNIVLGGAEAVTLSVDASGLHYAVDKGAVEALVENNGLVQADGGQVLLSARAANALAGAVINNTGTIEARVLVNKGGKIMLEADYGLIQTGTLKASEITAQTKNLIDAGTWDASAAGNGAINGGSIAITASNHAEQTASATLNADGGIGGSIRLTAGSDAWLSGTASASGVKGGEISITAPDLVLAGATLRATGETGGGRIRVGGGWQGKDADLANAGRTRLSATTLDVSATKVGDGGTAVVWSENETQFASTLKATGGAQGGNGGQAEISSHGVLSFGGTVDMSAPQGSNGRLLLDPKNIEIVGSMSGAPTVLSILNLPDPTPSPGEQFGVVSFGVDTIVELKNNGVSTNRIVIASSSDSAVASNAGAVRLYNSQTGAILATLTGSIANDKVGNLGITALTNGNYVVASSEWKNGTVPSAGAVTWGNGTTGVSGAVSANNSLVGSTAGDYIGSGYAGKRGVTALANGNYVVMSYLWDNLTPAADAAAAGVRSLGGGTTTIDAGAVTWGNGTTGVKGAVSSANSLVGVSPSDYIGKGGITALTNGNYVVTSAEWRTNSLFSATSMSWDSGTGAVTWGSGTAGVKGVVTDSNSLTGQHVTQRDQVGSGGVVALTNGNYVVISPRWGSQVNVSTGIFNGNRGAVTWGNGTGGTVGVVSATNSLIGSATSDQVGGGGVVALTNGNYVVASHNWKNGTVAAVGAVTWGNGTTGTVGIVAAYNSLVGSTANDLVGSDRYVLSVKALTNGNYVVASSGWDNGSVVDAGAVTWGNGATTGSRLIGAVSASNSLVGSTTNDKIGISGVTVLTNGNYVVSSPYWKNGTLANAGAVTWGNGATTGSRLIGAVSASNSLVGSTTNDKIGISGVTVLTNGNYVVANSGWDNGSVVDAGAVTWGSGTVGISGAVSATNSLVGSTAGDNVGHSGIAALTNGNYVVNSSLWNSGAIQQVGAVTWGNGAGGTVGAVSASNSLVGSLTFDNVGNGGVTALTNGNYVVASSVWKNGTLAFAGAATWGNGATGISGPVSATNSLVGNAQYVQVGNRGIRALTNGNYAVASSNWGYGQLYGIGAVTLGNGATGMIGAVSATNSLVGSTQGDSVGTSVTALSDGRALVRSAYWSNGTIKSAGRVDILDLSAPTATTMTNPHIFSLTPAATSTLLASDITALLNAGTAVTLQANNDITLSTALTVNNPSSNGGALTLQAGRSILLNANLSTDSGNLTLVANDSAANGVVNAYRDAGAAHITQAAGTTINPGTGAIIIDLRDGAGNTNNTAGALTLANIDTANAAGLSFQSHGFTARTFANNKIYDGTSAATLDAANMSGLAFQAGSNLSRITPTTGNFTNANAGTGRDVTSGPFRIRIDLGGGLSYAANLLKGGALVTASTKADILPKAISVTGITANNKTYDGTTAAGLNTGSSSFTGLVGSDTVTLGSAVGNFDNKNAGTGKTVNISGITLGGTEAGNYTLVGGIAPTATANIIKAVLTAKANDDAKLVTQPDVAGYGGMSYSGFVGGESASSAGIIGTPNVIRTGTETAAATYNGVLTLDTAGLFAPNYSFSTANGNYTITPAGTLLVKAGNTRSEYGTAPAYSVSAAYISTNGNALKSLTLTPGAGNTYAWSDGAGGAGTLSLAVAAPSTSTSGTLKTGNYTLTGSNVNTGASNFSALSFTGNLTVTPKALTGSIAAGSSTYSAALTTGSVSWTNLITNDVVNLGPVTINTAGNTSSSGHLKAGSYSGIQSASSLTGADAGNYSINSITGNYTVNKFALTGSIAAASTIYGSTLTPGAASLTNRILGDALSATTSVATTGLTSTGGYLKAGTHSNSQIISALSGADAGNYTFANVKGNYVVDKKDVSANANSVSKVYDRTTSISGVAVALTDAMSGDNVTSSGGSGSFNSPNAESGTAIYNLNGLVLSGTDRNNYNLIGGGSLTGTNGTIEKAPITAVTGITASNKIYDGDTSATLNSLTPIFGGLIAGDELTLSSSPVGNFDNKNAGTGKTVNISGITLGGTSAGNYILTGGASTKADILPKAISVTGIAANSKTYDGTTTAVLNASGSPTFTGLVSGDNLSLTGSAVGNFDNKNAGTGKTVNISGITLGGTSAGNYTLTGGITSTGAITKKSISVDTGSITAANKTYDGLTAANISGGRLTGMIAGDTVTLVKSGAFADANAGTGKTVNLTYALTNTDAGNYTVSNSSGTTTTADITKAALTMTANDASKLIGQADPAFTTTSGYRFSGFVNGESESALTGIAVNRTGTQTAAATYTGVLAPAATSSNYTITATNGNFTIVPADTLLVTLGNSTKVYGNSNPTLNLASTAQYVTGNVVRTVTLTNTGGGSYTYNDGLGTSGAFDVTTTATTGSRVDNYGITLANFTKTGNNFTTQTTQAGNLAVTPRGVALNTGTVSRVYDGTANANASITPSNLYGSDDVRATGSGSYDNKNAGIGKSYALSGLTLTGSTAGNYFLTSSTLNGTNGIITPRTLTWSVDNASSTYGATATAGAGHLSNVVAGDAVASTVTVYQTGTSTVVTPAERTAAGSYDQKVSAMTGADSANYTIASSGNTTGILTIGQKALVFSAPSISKVYDGSATYTTQVADLTAAATAAGVVFGDSLMDLTFAFDNKNAGSNKGVTTSGAAFFGTEASNYAISYAAANTGTITKKSISVDTGSITVANKTYDGFTAANVSGGTLTDVIGGDTVTLVKSGAFTDANAGAGKTVNLTYSLTSTDAGNYTISNSSGPTITADITKAALTMTANDASKLLTESDPAFTARYTGFVNGEGASVLTNPTITRNGNAEAAGSYTGVLAPTATSGNYTITTANGNFTIVPAQTLLIQLGDGSKVYGNSLPDLNSNAVTSARYLAADGSTIRTVAVSSTGNNGYSGDDGSGTTFNFTLGTTALADSNVGNYALTTSNFTKSGDNFTTQNTQNGNLAVTQRAVTVGASSISKVYDGNAAMSNAALAIANKVGADDVLLGGNGLYANRDAGTGKDYTVSNLALSGAKAGNYYLTATDHAGNDGVITPRTLNVTWSGIGKVYDGNTSATVTTADDRVAGDSLAITRTAAFQSKNAGTGRAIDLTGVSLTGADGANYTVASTGSTTADIAKRALNVVYTGVNRAYDGTTAVTVITSDDRVTGDTFDIARTATVQDKNAGTQKAIAVSGISLSSGNDGDNYTTATSGSAGTADITRKSLTVTAPTLSKTYDGGLSQGDAMGSATMGQLGTGDSVNVASILNYLDKNAGTGKTVQASALTIKDSSNADMTGNYVIGYVDSTASAINRKTLNVTWSGNKTYDGTTTATVSQTNDRVSGDALTVTNTAASFADKNAGTGKPITISGISLAGADAGNYTIATTGRTTADIAKRALTMIGATAADKTFDGLTSAVTALGTLNGLIGAETLGISSIGNFVDANAGTGKRVNIVLAMADGANGGLAGNYTISDATATATIKPKPPTTSQPLEPLPTPIPTTPTPPPQVPKPIPAPTPDAPKPIPSPTPDAGPIGTGGGGTGPGGNSPGDGGPIAITLRPGSEVPTGGTGTGGGGTGAGSGGAGGSSGRSASGGVDSSGFISVRTFEMTTVPASALFSFTLPKDTFKHSDSKATVVLEARMDDGKPLPDWLSFNQNTGRFTGQAPGDVQDVHVRVTARDTSGDTAATKVMLRFNAVSEVQ